MNEQAMSFFVDDGSKKTVYDKDSADQLKISKLVDTRVVFDVRTVSGVPVDLSGKAVVLTVKKRPTDTIAVAEVAAIPQDIPTSSSGVFVFPSTLWDYASAGYYVYSIVASDPLTSERVLVSSIRGMYLGV